MKINPIYKRDTMISARSFRLVFTVMFFNTVLALVILLNMYSVIKRVKFTAEIQFSSFTNLYTFVAVVEFILLMFIMPAMTAGSISGERERQTLDILLTTTMKPRDIILGKLNASFSTMFVMIVSSFPMLGVSFVYGGVRVTDVFVLLFCYLAVALLSGSLGICFSSIFKSSTIATVVSYGVLILIAVGTYAANVFSLSISKLNMHSTYALAVSGIENQASSGGWLYLLLLNPVTTFYVMINGQAGDNQVMRNLNSWFGSHPNNVIIENWVIISIFIQIVMGVVFLLISIKAISPKNRKNVRI